MSRFRRAMFARHSNPWSAWTRWASTPLVLVPVWTRRWRDAAPVAAWLLVNPVIFPEPADDHNWATRAILGEELWITRRPKDGAWIVSAVTSAAALCAIVAARRHRLRVAATATAIQMALTLVYWQMMARTWIDSRRSLAACPTNRRRLNPNPSRRTSTPVTARRECRRSSRCARRSRLGTAPRWAQRNSTPKLPRVARSKNSTRRVNAPRPNVSNRSASRCSPAVTHRVDSASRAQKCE